MPDAMAFLVRQGPLVLFLFVLAEQLGLPFPAVPVLLGMGALARGGHFPLWVVVVVAVGASLLADLAWYALGRWRGARVLNLLCRISLEPDSCVRTTQNVLTARGARALLYAKFVPGLSTVAPPVAGLIRMRPARFLVWDGAGALLWSATYLALGWVFGAQIERVVLAVLDVGGRVFVLAFAALAAYLAWKYAQRRRFLRQIDVDRITPEELRRKIDAGEEVVVVDLRHSADFEVEAGTLPGARHLSPDALDEGLHDIPRGREVILFCT
ncbi:MAG TPA: VTT domain-containing protein [Vicinamibacteria bacterium]|nr:VTT domain-containing protein [Vicinamibacteria bacterium]